MLTFFAHVGRRLFTAWITTHCLLIQTHLEHHSAANVWETCEAIKAPMNNKTALFKRMGGALKAVNDTIREVRVLYSYTMCPLDS